MKFKEFTSHVNNRAILLCSDDVVAVFESGGEAVNMDPRGPAKIKLPECCQISMRNGQAFAVTENFKVVRQWVLDE